MTLLHHWFANPWAFWLLLSLPALSVIGAFGRRRRRRVLTMLGSRPALDALTARRSWFRTIGAFLGTLGLISLVVGIAGPQWGEDRSQAMALTRDLVVVLDLSKSMLADDVLGASSPNRLGRAKDALADLVETIQRRGGQRLALVIFAARARVACPLTRDYDHFRETLESLDAADPLLDIGPLPGGSPSGTRIGAALRLATEIHDPGARGLQDLMLLSDGDDPAGDEEWRAGVAVAQANDIPVITVGIGDPDAGGRIPLAAGYLKHAGQEVRTRLQEKPLAEIARRTHGVYLPARTKGLPLGELFADIVATRAKREDTEDVLPVLQQRYFWFFMAALIVFACRLVLGDGRLIRPSIRKQARSLAAVSGECS